MNPRSLSPRSIAAQTIVQSGCSDCRCSIPSGAATMRAFDEDDFREVGAIICGALAEGADVAALAVRSEALCEKRPLYPGFRGYTTYVA